MKTLTTLFVCFTLAGCAAAPAAQAPTTGSSAAAASATKPDASKAIAHFREHVKYPATRSAVLAACADTPEFTGAEKKWINDNLPDKRFASADDVVASLHL
jgi:hypothetical protein